MLPALDTAIAGTRRPPDEGGFTLIEVMVVLLVIAILLAVAIPAFLSVTTSANDRAAQSDLHLAVQAALEVESPLLNFSAATTTALHADEANLSFVSSVSVNARAINVYVPPMDPNDGAIVFAALSSDGMCWFAMVVATTPVAGTIGVTTYPAPPNAANARGVSSAGVYYGKQLDQDTSTTYCLGDNGPNRTTVGPTEHWVSTFSSA